MATCKDCLHAEVCEEYGEVFSLIKCGKCSLFKDRSRFVELPCKVGDTLFVPTRNFISEYEIEYFHFGKYGIWFNTKLIKGISTRLRNAHIEAIGKDVFLTREEAERALSKRTQKKGNEFYRGHCVSDDGKFCKHIKAAKGDNLSNDNTMSCEYGEVNCPYAKPLEEVNAK